VPDKFRRTSSERPMTFVLPFPAIDPVAIQIGPFAIRWYALAYIAGIFIGWWYAKRLVANARIWSPSLSPMQPADIDDVVIWASLGIILGGRVGYVLFYDLPLFLNDPIQIFAVWNGGMSFHGGFLGTILAMVLFARSRGIPAWCLIDVIAASVPFGLFFGRLANFINGELYGRASDAPWAMVFAEGDIPRHPSQLYEAALEGVVFFLLLRLFTHRYKRLRYPSFISGMFCIGYGVARTFVEFFREPDIQIGYLAGGLTMGMALSLPMIAYGIYLIVTASRRPPLPEAPATP
jgi:phosphatidylglycerol:prolipoprotein diacylglycerol transferase